MQWNQSFTSPNPRRWFGHWFVYTPQLKPSGSHNAGWDGCVCSRFPKPVHTFLHTSAVVPSSPAAALWLQRFPQWSSSSKWILMSCQPHRVTSGQSNSGHKQIYVSKLFSHIYQPSVKSVYKTNEFCRVMKIATAECNLDKGFTTQ